ncbi:P2X receptor [Planoprotostelium fungivorum]|uniref:P2X receptor n=1 Tax=Planoprotostelium fungivorum TaxID=1890364 RepID=A0A2P6NY04_9EUKA|nr:P2X receptor [Planoprotostelium fungivorum]
MHIKKPDSLWDSLLIYTTVKVVKIRDWRLGVLHYAFMLGILGYVAVYAVWLNKGYLQKDQPVGSVRSTLAPPDQLNATNTFPYCSQYQPAYQGFNNFPCIYYSGHDVQMPDALANPFMIVTRTKSFTLNGSPNINCTGRFIDQPECIITNKQTKDPTAGTTQRYYTAGIEDYTLFMEHVVYGRSSHFSGRNEDMEERFYDSKGDLMTIDTNTGDIITVRQLLSMAGITSLDTISSISNHTARYDGVQIMVIIDYQSEILNSNKYTYTVRASQIIGVDTTVTTSTQDGSVVTYNGIIVSYIQTGTIGVFSFPALLTSIIGGAVLTGVATTVVDLMAVYLMPEKEWYSEKKFDDSLARPERNTISLPELEEPLLY